MDSTFAQRREYINSNPPIADLKVQYPCLFSVAETGNEFRRLTATELHSSFKTSLLKVAPDIVNFVKCSKKTFRGLWSCLELCGESPADALGIKAVASLLALPQIFGNTSQLVKEFEVSMF